MKLLVLVAFVIGLVYSESLLEELVAKRDSSPNGVIHVTSATYKKYALAARDYHLFVFFTATNAACQGCRAANQPIDEVGDSLKRAYPVPIVSGPDASPSSTLFILKADYPKCQEVFAAHPNLTGVPHLVYIPPGPPVASPPEAIQKTTKWLPGFNAKNEYQITSHEVDGQEILNWLRVKTRDTKKKVEIYTDPWPNIFRMLFVITAGPAVLLGLVVVVGARRFALFASMAMIAFILAGGMWVLIRGADWADPRSGDWIVRWNGSQHIMEGVVVAALCCAGGFALVTLSGKKATSDNAATATFWTGLGGAVFTVCFFFLRNVYVAKNHGYLVYTS